MFSLEAVVTFSKIVMDAGIQVCGSLSRSLRKKNLNLQYCLHNSPPL